MCTKFLYFWETHGSFITFLLLNPHVNFFIFSQFPSPIITVARTSALFLAGARLIFSEKHRGLAPFAWLLFSHEYITAVQLFLVVALCRLQRYHHQIFTKCADRRRVQCRLSNVSEHSSSSMLKRHTRVSSTLSDVYVS